MVILRNLKPYTFRLLPLCLKPFFYLGRLLQLDNLLVAAFFDKISDNIG